MRDIYISVICYANEEEVLSFSRKLKKQTISNSLVLLVNYNRITSQKQKEWLEIELRTIGIRYMTFTPHENLGYLHGSLYGLSKSELKEDSWCVICNTDLDFDDMFFENLFHADGADNKDVWVLAPMVIHMASGRPQNPFMVNRPSVMSMHFRTIMYSNYYFYRAYIRLSRIKKVFNRKKPIASRMYVYATHGCFMAMKSDLVMIMINDDAPIFMYGEELLVAEYARMNNKLTLFIPNYRIDHLQREIANRKADKNKQKWFKQSIDYIYVTYFK